uniref:SH2 domain-containing protein n=1 Tax=Globodera pallida TaxID=36090 RepID=A0A183BKR2_GLOPA
MINVRLSQRTPAGQRRIRAQFLDLLSCPHRPQQCAPPTAQCVPLPGYHRTNEFLLCFGMPAEREEQVWHKLWQCACQAIVLLDSCSDGQTQFDVPSHFIETDQNGAIRTIKLIKTDNNNHIQLRRDDGKELFIRLHRIHSTALLHNPWLQIERLQCELQDQHRGQLAVLELGMAVPSAVPFLFCVFQSAACQLEQESAVDVFEEEEQCNLEEEEDEEGEDDEAYVVERILEKRMDENGEAEYLKLMDPNNGWYDAQKNTVILKAEVTADQGWTSPAPKSPSSVTPGGSKGCPRRYGWLPKEQQPQLMDDDERASHVPSALN